RDTTEVVPWRFCALVFMLSEGSSSCRTSSQQDCLAAPFVPGHNLVGEGFDVVTLQRKGVYVSDMETFLTPSNSCTLGQIPFIGGQLQKLPLSVPDWRAVNRSNLQISSAVFSSASALLESATSAIGNDWKVGLNQAGLINLQLAGSKSTESRFATSRIKVDKTYFSSHQLSCTYYSLPPLNPEFHQHLLSLPKGNTSNAMQQYRRFIEIHGTHYILTSIRTYLATLSRVSASQVKDCLNVGLKLGLGLADASIAGGSCRKILANQHSVMSFSEGLMNYMTKVSGGNGWLGETRNDSEGFYTWLGSLKHTPDIIKPSNGHHNGQPKNPPPPQCAGNRPNLSPNCCPFNGHRGRLRVTVIRVWGLRGDPVGRTEGYVKLWYDGSFRQTQRIRSNNPWWNKQYDFGNVYTGHRLKLEVWDKDVRYDDHLGGCSVNLSRGTHYQSCGLNHGGFEFSFHLERDPHLTGSLCNIYWPHP
uniref:C2 domain-containing protein n=1 Tax=Pygocentrus nattereri TaxID=42514 RepID=A0A3B4DIF3_PYGNA